jgi:quercetin dioxygenase-like cupin family protein
MAGHSLTQFPLHLDAQGGAVPQPEFTNESWFERYAERTDSDGPSGRLVSMFSFSDSWSTWEMHPIGDEVVLCISGAMTLHQEQTDGSVSAVDLRAGEYAINPPGCWHTADAREPVTALFITCGQGTTHRPR